MKTRAAAGGLTINSVYDPLLDETNGRITSGSNLVINGVNIKIAGENPSNGVFFTKVGSSEQQKVRLIVHNNPSQLTVLLPTLAPGDYQLTITTQFSTSTKSLKELRWIEIAWDCGSSPQRHECFFTKVGSREQQKVSRSRKVRTSFSWWVAPAF